MDFRPPRHRQLLHDWIDGLTIDWPISRRRYYHTEIPLWYCNKCGDILAPPPGKYYRPWKDPAPFDRCPKCGGREFRGEERVFDTWMDSSVSNLWVSRYRDDESFFQANFPTSLRPQGKDIVRTWLYYTTLKSWLLRGTPAFRSVFIHGLGLDSRGRAMHRTLGNIIEPWPLLRRHGADAVRFFVASETNPGDDFRISESKIGGSGKFLTKLWNIARFISTFEEPSAGKLRATDEWILAELNRLVEECRGAYEAYDLFIPVNRCRDFLWNLFAPHYIEMVKGRAYAGDSGARWTLHACLRDGLRLLAPIIPFSTDKIWRSMYEGSVHSELFPLCRDGIAATRLELTESIVAFNSDVWKSKRDRGQPLNVEVRGISIPDALIPFEEDLRRMHRLI